MLRTAEALTNGSSVFMYRFAFASPRAVHGLELPFMWNALNRRWTLLEGRVPANPPQSLATAMHGAWAEFIKTGSPQHRDLPSWPAYDLKNRSTMVFDTTSRVVDDPRANERKVWATAAHWPL
jgi:para-nitrobenzyl esterase